jgi:uridylate kinase
MTEEATVSEDVHVDLRAVSDPEPGSETAPDRRYNRVLLKLSGEVFGGGQVGLDPDVVRAIAAQIAEAASTGVQISVVIGGGNFFRGAELQKKGLDRTRADYMGMLGIVMNCLALQDFLEKAGQPTRVQTAITMGQIAEPYIPLRAIRHLEKGRIVIFGAGFGVPFFSTDSVAAQRALEMHSDVVLISKNGVDGVYTADPRTDPTAKRLDHVTYAKALQQRLRVVDAAAFALAQENKLPMVVFGMEGEGNIVRAIRGEKIGTLVDAG